MRFKDNRFPFRMRPMNRNEIVLLLTSRAEEHFGNARTQELQADIEKMADELSELFNQTLEMLDEA